MTIQQRAAEVAALQLDVGHPVLMRASSAHTFLCPRAFLRVVEEWQNPWATLDVAAYVSQQLGGPHPLVARPIEVVVDNTRLFVELYERSEFRDSRASPAVIGEHLARMHALDTSTMAFPAYRRVTVTKSRIARAPLAVQDELRPLLERADAAITATPGPLVLCHGDTNYTNLVHDGTRWVWVDFEYAGLAPSAVDVGVAIADLIRHHGRGAARDFVESYVAAGGSFNAADVVVLSDLREVIGVADYSPCAGTPREAKFSQRLSTLGEPFRTTSWRGL